MILAQISDGTIPKIFNDDNTILILPNYPDSQYDYDSWLLLHKGSTINVSR